MSKKPKFQKPSGMHDVLPSDQKYFKLIYDKVAEIAEFYGFHKIDTPILEETDLFARGVGSATDIVQKEMYNLKTKGGDYLSLRPEGTAPIVRAYIEHGMSNLPQPVKFYYFGPFFRYERSQAGRYRQFWQFGLESLGEKNPATDVQLIQIFYNILKELGLKNIIVEVNSLGEGQCRPYYKKALKDYLRSRTKLLCTDCKRRIKENPLRVLDCKVEKCQEVKEGAPHTVDHLCKDCSKDLKSVLEFLDEIEVPYTLNPFLVRGLDYYTKTVFEFFKEDESLALGGGGRYDNLMTLLGGTEAPATGGAFGVERIVHLLKEKKDLFKNNKKDRIFFAQLGDLAKRKSLNLFEDFRKAKIPVVESVGKDSLKAQLNRANRIGSRYVLILGQQEAVNNMIIIRDMRTGKQDIIKLEKTVEEMRKRIKKS